MSARSLLTWILRQFRWFYFYDLECGCTVMRRYKVAPDGRLFCPRHPQ